MTQQELEANLKKISETLEYEMKSIIETTGAIATGALLNELSVQFEEENEGYRLAISYPFYGKFIDEGRGPSTRMPPLDAIKEWTRIKGIPEEAAFPIAKKIQREGYKGINFTRVLFGQEERNALKKNIGQNYMDYITTILTKDK
jgi:hypothetical protein